ncbi:MAG: Gfo/Idh/MocA family oxidoreductase [Pseudomonadota bacterium]
MAINFALLGTGRIAENALSEALKVANGSRLWSVFSRDLERARKFASSHVAAAPKAAFDDLDALLADPELHAVLIATPDRLHAEQAIAAARAGKHVLVEKPMATTLEECEAMIRACEEARVKLGVAYHMRWHHGHRQVAELAHAGEFGELRHVRVQWSWPAPDNSNWRAAADMGRWWSLAGVGTHCLDQIRWLLTPVAGDVAQMSSVISKSHFEGPHDETAILGFRFENGATGELCSSVLFGAPPRMELYGTRGWVRFEDTLGPHGAGRIETHNGPLSFSIGNPYQGEVEDFVHAIREDRPPEVDGVEGMRNVELMLQAVR